MEHLQHAASDAVVALVVVKTKRGIGIHGIESIILHLIGAHLVGQTQTPAFLRQVEHDAATRLLELRKRKLQLIAAVAAPRAKYVAGETGRMQTNEDRLGEIRRPDNN